MVISGITPPFTKHLSFILNRMIEASRWASPIYRRKENGPEIAQLSRRYLPANGAGNRNQEFLGKAIRGIQRRVNRDLERSVQMTSWPTSACRHPSDPSLSFIQAVHFDSDRLFTYSARFHFTNHWF